MVDIFDEVSEDLRNERAVALLKRYGGLLLVVCVLVLLGVAGQQVWDWHEAKQNGKAAADYLALTAPMDAVAAPTDAQRQADAAALEKFAGHAPAGYRVLALLRAAGFYADAGQTKQAEGIWDQVADDSRADPLLRDLANLLWAQHAMGSAPDAAVLARLQPLTGQQNAFHGLARESQALVYLREGKNDLAKALFSQIATDPDAPDGVRNRADGLLAKLNG